MWERWKAPVLRHRILRGATGTLVVLAFIATVGAGYQALADAQDRREFPAPGEMVPVGQHRMHLYCLGKGSPTVVLEAGATGFGQTWAWIQRELAAETRVCSYDRAGMGWSDTWHTPHDARAIARNLHDLLIAAEERAPYVLIGHSLGGSLAQAYAGIYPDEVEALGFVDPSHPDQLDRFGPDVQREQKSFQAMIGVAATLGHIGVLRATNALGRLAKGLPERDYQTARMFAASPKHLKASHAEMKAWNATMDAARQVASFGDRPVIVISATEAMEGMPESMLATNHAMHAELAGMSSAGRHIKVEGTNHYSLLMRRDHAALTAGLLRELVGETRQLRETMGGPTVGDNTPAHTSEVDSQ